MAYDPLQHHRRSIRLRGFDYRQAGFYFITLCTQGKEYLFGRIIESKMVLNAAGKMVEKEWIALPMRFPNIKLHDYIIMPNHFHGIIEIVGATLVVAQNAVEMAAANEQAKDSLPAQGQPQGLPLLISAFKSISTLKYTHGVTTQNWPPFNQRLWQRNYWERIIRDEKEYHHLADYIQNNPLNWKTDSLR
ncbi:transposase [Rufibacter immobilis]|uniref:transposase n=1 Tax=Rufibacter immobilis TaxID=1348778 RepID=UPI0035EE9D2A